MKYLSPIFGVVAFLALAGCGGGDSNPQGVKVTGKILLDGEPAPAGVIEFIPTGPSQIQAQGLVQENGTFEIASHDGPSPGEYTVKIFCAKKTGRRIKSMASSEPDGTMDERIPVIPPQYNTKTILKKTIVASGENDFTFDLKTKE